MDTDIFDRFIQRLLVGALLPNVLVWGFWEIGIDNDRNPLWFALIGPYWKFEKLLCLSVLLIGLGLILWWVLGAVGTLIFTPTKSDVVHEDREAEVRILAKEQAFRALPKAEQDRIRQEDLKQADRLWQEHMLACEARKLRQLEQDERLKAGRLVRGDR